MNDYATAPGGSDAEGRQGKSKEPAAKAEKKGALQMRCIPDVVAGRSMTSTDNERSASKRQNPCVSKGFGVDCHQRAVDDTVGATGDGHFLTTWGAYVCSG